MSIDRQTLLDLVDAAFAPEPIDGTGAFSEWGGSYPDAPDYQARIDGRSWNQLDAAYLVRRADALGFLGTRALIAVLPVYLRAVVEHGFDSDAAGMLTIILRRPGAGPGPDLGPARFSALLAALDRAQRSAIAAVLGDLLDRNAGTRSGALVRTTFDSCWAAHLAGDD